MKLALRQAGIAVTRGQTPFGAVVVDRDGRLIGEGHNTCVPTSTRSNEYKNPASRAGLGLG